MLGMTIAGLAGLGFSSRLAAESIQGAPSEEWLDAIASRKHRAFLDIRTFDPSGTPFRKAANLLQALTQAHGAAEREVGIAFGAGSSAIAHVLGPKVWAEYGIGAKVAGLARSPAEAASLRTEAAKWSALGGTEVATMRSHGMRVLACRNSLRRWAGEFAVETGESIDVVNAKLIAGLHTGVEPVPAMIAAAVLAQSRQLSYVAIG
jgi:intracellular sulfur oxidation DsrE/DsrF family protein